MILQHLNILNYKNIREADLNFSEKINGFIGLNGQGKTNLLDAIYILSFTKSAFNAIDSMNITLGEHISMVSGEYTTDEATGERQSISVSCGIRRGQKKQFRYNKKDYQRLIDHIGQVPLVMVSPTDEILIHEGSEYRRKFMDSVIAQYDHTYLEYLNTYSALLKQRNALLKQMGEQANYDSKMLEVYEQQMVTPAQYIYRTRKNFIDAFVPYFQSTYSAISGDAEQVELSYVSQLHDRDLAEALERTRQRDIILGWTSQGIHKDDIEMSLKSASEAYPIKQIGSQGQQKTYILAMKLAQSLYLSQTTPLAPNRKTAKPILLLDDIFDKLDSERVKRIVQLVRSQQFGQIFITDTDRQSLSNILQDSHDASLFAVEDGKISPL